MVSFAKYGLLRNRKIRDLVGLDYVILHDLHCQVCDKCFILGGIDMQDEKNYDNVITLIIDILKAVVLFAFRLALLIPMIVITIFGATLGGSEASLTYGIGKCIKHPFKAFGEAIRNISYAIKNYRSNK